MNRENFYLSSLDSARFSGVFACEIRARKTLHGDRHALVVSLDPPALGQDVSYPLGIDEVLLVDRFDGDDIWVPATFPFFVYICTNEELDSDTDKPQILAWGELYRTAADAREHRFDSAGSDTGQPG
jgi:hypothetical protein